MTEAKTKTYAVTSPINHDRPYEVGETIELTHKEALSIPDAIEEVTQQAETTAPEKLPQPKSDDGR